MHYQGTLCEDPLVLPSRSLGMNLAINNKNNSN